MSTLAVNTWWAVKIWMENVTQVLNEFLPLTQILNLKKPKINVPIGYLTLKIIHNYLGITYYPFIHYYYLLLES
jgi:hypothetical protein